MRKKIVSFVIIALMALSVFIPLASATGPATDTLIYKRVPVDLVGQALRSGDIDMYIYALRSIQAGDLADDPAFKLYYAPAGLNDIVLNPAPNPDGSLNPLSITDVRFALNYIMNRDYIINQIFQGFAAPMVTFLSSYDPDYVTIYDIIAKYDFQYDVTLADQLVTAAMVEAGAVKLAGKWTWEGEPITLKFIIRIEDERREIGDMFATDLETLGFTIERLYMPFGQAIDILYGTDPYDHDWDLYTEGWGKGAPDKYDQGTINQYGAPWYGYMPGWTEPGWWQYENALCDELGQRIYLGDYSSKEERDALYVQMAEIVIQESVRIWANTRLDINPALSTVQGLTGDLGAGLRGIWNPREVYIEGKSTVNIGHLWVWTETTVWNPVAGHNDVYSVDLWRALYDPLLWNHPFSGMPTEIRAEYEVDTAGPTGTLDVPTTAFLWDAVNDEWVNVASGTNATSKVTFDMSKYIGAKWHDGGTIGWEDLLHGIYSAYEIAFDPVKSTIESYRASDLKVTLPVYKGFDISGTNLIVYLDYWHFSEPYIANFADIFANSFRGHYPWQLCQAMQKVVFEDKTAAFSQSAATAFGVPWLSLVLENHAQLVNDALVYAKNNNVLPSNIFTVNGVNYCDEAEAQARYTSSIEWFEEHNNLVISDGPYYLNAFDSAGQYAELKAFRDPTYPFEAGEFNYGEATAPEITRIGIPTVIPATDASFVIDISGEPPFGAKYLIKDPITGEVLDIGDATPVTTSRFIVTLPASFTKDLSAGLYELTIAAYSEDVAFVSSEKTFFNVLSLAGIENAISALQTDLNNKIGVVNSNLSNKIDQSNTNLTNSINALASTTNTLMMLLGLVAVLMVVNIVLLMRKK